MSQAEMAAQVRDGKGFIAALDQSGGSTPKALRLYGVSDDAYANDAEMFDLIHAMRARIVAAPSFSGEKVIGAILFEMTMDRDFAGKPAAQALWEDHGVVPFLKIDKGLEEQGKTRPHLSRQGVVHHMAKNAPIQPCNPIATPPHANLRQALSHIMTIAVFDSAIFADPTALPAAFYWQPDDTAHYLTSLPHLHKPATHRQAPLIESLTACKSSTNSGKAQEVIG